MKINTSSDHFLIKKSDFKDLFNIMKICLFLLFAFTLQLMATNTNAQDAIIELRSNSVTVSQLISEIEKQTDYLVVYSNREVNTSRTVSLKNKSDKVSEYLNQTFSGTDIGYDFEKNYIVLSKKTQQTASTITNLAQALQQQGKTVRGTVTDSSGEPVIGATIVVKDNPSQGTVTDIDGNFILSNLPENAVLQITYVGMKPKEANTAGRSTINVVLDTDVELLDEVVVVGYGTQRKSTLTGAVSSVQSEQINITPVGNITNALTGKLPGLITVQGTGLPGSDQAILNIRGFGSPLVIIDGVEANLTNLDPNQIESISILKDGSSAIYGSRAGNGVVLITTKRGVSQEPTITLNTSYTMQGVTNQARTLSSGQWTELQRESHLNAGLPESTAPYTAEEVAKYYAGDDPAYPSSDWYNFTFRDWAPQQNHNLSLRGGSERLKYMGYLGYQKQETMVKRNGGSYERFNLLSNIDAAITKSLALTIDLMAAYEIRKFPARGLGNWDGNAWQDLYSTRPWFPTTLPDATKNASGGIDVGSVALSTNMDVWGYNLNKPKDLRGTITLSYDVPFINGLTAKAFVNYIDTQDMGKWFQKPYQWYTYNYAADLYTLAGSLWTAAQGSESIYTFRRITQQYSLNYDRALGPHNLTALALLETIDDASKNFSASRRDYLTPSIEQLFAGSPATQTNNGSASEAGRASLIGRINYSYKDRYLLDLILRADATSRFIKSERWGYFPGVSLGWVLSQEEFMKNLSALEFLKLRASYGSSGYDNVGSFRYLTGYQISGLYQWGNNFTSGLESTGIANPNLTWEIMKLYNVGLDFSIMNRAIYGSLEAFYRTRTGIPGTRVISYPSTFGASLPTENLNSLNNRGFEFQLGTVKNTGDFTYDISANISWSRAKWDHYDEPEYEDPDQQRQNQISGQWTDRVFGYVSDGLFTSMDEISSLPYVYSTVGAGDNATLRPGDVKYLDVNNDNVLDWRDQVEIGKGNSPHWFFGLNGTLMYKGFDLVTLFQGAFGYTSSRKPYFSNIDYFFNERWTEVKNDPNATIPRPGGAGSNYWTSDYWHKSVFYIRLKNGALGYTFPKHLVEKIGVERIRLYISGTNLLTLSTLSKYYIDPEAPSGVSGRYYPQQRTISFGLNLDF